MTARLWAWGLTAAALLAAAAWLAWCAWLSGPWGFAPPLPPEPAPRAGGLLLSRDGAEAATVRDVVHLGPPAVASGTAVFLRGARHGRKRAGVLCDAPGRLWLAGEPAIEYAAGGSRITDMVADALCAGHPLLQVPEPGATT